MLFSPLALEAISRLSRGIPRVINLLCHKALLITSAKGKRCVSLFDVWQAYRVDKRVTIIGQFLTAALGISIGILFFKLLG